MTVAETWSQEDLMRHSGYGREYCRDVIAKLTPVESDDPMRARRYLVQEMFASIMELERARRVAFDASDAKQRAEMARAEKLEIENAVRRGELVSLVDQVEIDSRTASMLARKLESIPGRIKRRYPGMPGKYLAALADGLAVARNEHVDEVEEFVRDREDEAVAS